MVYYGHLVLKGVIYIKFWRLMVWFLQSSLIRKEQNYDVHA